MSEQLSLLPGYLSAHLQLTLVALLLGIAISVPAGLWLTRHARVEPAVLGVASVLQTIPSLALLALMVPLLAALGAFSASAFGVEIRSIGFLPAVIALTLYSVLPILHNTVTGLRSVDPALVEAARGVGMTERQLLLRVELPLALPVIVAGLRTATVWVVGTATLATPVGATSLGNFIFSGLQTRNLAAVLVGSVAAALLAIGLDALIRMLERGVRLRSRGTVAAALGVFAVLYGFVAVTLLSSGGRAAERPVAIGAKTFTEQYILAQLLARRVSGETGAATRTVDSLGSTVAFDALRAGELDLYVDYSGTIWATIMKREGLPEGRSAVLAGVRDFLADEHGIELVGALGFQNTYALAMREDRASELGIATIGDLARHAARLEIGADYEFLARPEWAALDAAYGLPFRAKRSMDSSLMYQAVAAGEVDVISAFSTDGRIAAYGLRLLADEKGVIPPYDAILLASPALARERPEVIAALRPLVGSIDEARMQAMNREVDLEGRSPSEVAEEFLRTQ